MGFYLRGDTNSCIHFDTALKLNRYLLTAIYAAYNSMRNNYETRDFITSDNLNRKIASMNGDIQVERYEFEV